VYKKILNSVSSFFTDVHQCHGWPWLWSW